MFQIINCFMIWQFIFYSYQFQQNKKSMNNLTKKCSQIFVKYSELLKRLDLHCDENSFILQKLIDYLQKIQFVTKPIINQVNKDNFEKNKKEAFCGEIIQNCSKQIDHQMIQNRPYNLDESQSVFDPDHSTQSLSSINPFKVQWDRNSCSPKKIQIKQGSKIRKRANGDTISSLQALPKTGKHKVIFKILNNTSIYSISFGILTDKLKGKQFYKKQQQLISYYSHQSQNGSFNIDLAQIVPYGETDLGTPIGGSIMMVVDVDNWKITFTRMAFKWTDRLTNQRKQVAQKSITKPISNSFKNKNIYVFARLKGPGDELEIINN